MRRWRAWSRLPLLSQLRRAVHRWVIRARIPRSAKEPELPETCAFPRWRPGPPTAYWTATVRLRSNAGWRKNFQTSLSLCRKKLDHSATLIRIKRSSRPNPLHMNSILLGHAPSCLGQSERSLRGLNQSAGLPRRPAIAGRLAEAPSL